MTDELISLSKQAANEAAKAWDEGFAAGQAAALVEPKTEVPTDQELLEVLDRATADFPPNHPEAESMTGARYALALEVRKARAVLSRWGTPSSRSNLDG